VSGARIGTGLQQAFTRRAYEATPIESGPGERLSLSGLKPIARLSAPCCCHSGLARSEDRPADRGAGARRGARGGAGSDA
jgi:hypothetical protein